MAGFATSDMNLDLLGQCLQFVRCSDGLIFLIRYGLITLHAPRA
jgi:hypothetical protein